MWEGGPGASRVGSKRAGVRAVVALIGLLYRSRQHREREREREREDEWWVNSTPLFMKVVFEDGHVCVLVMSWDLWKHVCVLCLTMILLVRECLVSLLYLNYVDSVVELDCQCVCWNYGIDGVNGERMHRLSAE